MVWCGVRKEGSIKNQLDHSRQTVDIYCCLSGSFNASYDEALAGPAFHSPSGWTDQSTNSGVLHPLREVIEAADCCRERSR